MRPSGYPITPCSPLHDSHLSLVIVTSAPVSSQNTLCMFFHFFICLSLSRSVFFFCFFTNIFSKIPLLLQSVTSPNVSFFELIFLKLFCSSYANCYSTFLLIIQCFSYFLFACRFCCLYFCWWPSKCFFFFFLLQQVMLSEVLKAMLIQYIAYFVAISVV